MSTFTLELVLTALLVFIVFCATDAERAVTAAHIPVRLCISMRLPSQGSGDRVLCESSRRGSTGGGSVQVLAPFAVGFAVFIAHLCAIPLDGKAAMSRSHLTLMRSCLA